MQPCQNKAKAVTREPRCFNVMALKNSKKNPSLSKLEENHRFSTRLFQEKLCQIGFGSQVSPLIWVDGNTVPYGYLPGNSNFFV